MKRYDNNQLIKRNKIINSHLILIDFLDKDLINVLINLFDVNNYQNNFKIVNYIEKERKLRGLNDSNISIKSEVYGQNKQNSTLFLKVLKNNIELFHLTIHLILRTINAEKDGIIHMYKNIYKSSLTSRNRYKLYTLILVERPINKPDSLVFSIADDYNTSSLQNSNIYDKEIKQEMDVIITVLNRMFDENNEEYYIGNLKTKLFPVHNKTDQVLNNINRHSKLASRKNKGIKILPNFNNTPIIRIYHNRKNTKRKTRKHQTRKLEFKK